MAEPGGDEPRRRDEPPGDPDGLRSDGLRSDGPGAHGPRSDEPRSEGELATAGAPDELLHEGIRRGTTIGRYVVAELVGRGGMGVVYKAYDPVLNRGVALKLLAWRDHGGAAERGRERLLREAQALAQLSHPNVVSIFDVGAHEDGLFLATELIEGETLRRWLRRSDATAATTLAALLAAGEGLAAAHRAGIVHRDFKPDNVMMGRDGRVRVLDFGLARPDAASSGSLAAMTVAAEPGVEESRRSLTSAPVTLDGAVVGTPPYMAPELHLGEPATPLSDQFAFCVSLYEALYGERPFPGATLAELRSYVLLGRVRPEPKGRAVPAHVRKALLRGLHRSPAERYPFMDALLADLRRDPARQLRRGAVAAGVLGVALVASAATTLAVSRRGSLCAGGEGELGDAWSRERGQAVAAAFQATRVAYAGPSLARVDAALSGYRSAWLAEYKAACEATHVRRVQSAARLDERMACLRQRARELSALTDVLTRADAAIVERSVGAVERLPPVRLCAEERGVFKARPPSPSPAAKAHLEAAGQALAEARSHELTGKVKEGLALATRAVIEARAGEDLEREAHALLARGQFEEELGESATAAATLREAWRQGERAGSDSVVATARSRLVWMLGERQGHYDAALELAPLAEAAIERLENPDEARLGFESVLAMIRMRQDRSEDALAHTERALALARRTLAPGDTRLADAWNTHGNVLRTLKRTEEARAAFTTARDIWSKAFGPEHPAMIVAFGNMAIMEAETGEAERAIRAFDDGAALVRRVLGPRHPQVGSFLNNGGFVLARVGRLEEAHAHFEEAVRHWRETLGEGSPKVAMALHNLASVEGEQGELTAARAHLEEAMSIRAKTLGPKSPSYGDDLAVLGDLQRLAGDRERATASYGRALELLSSAPAHVGRPRAALGLALLELEGRQWAAASRHLDEAASLLATMPQEERLLARVEAAQARAVVAKDPARAQSLVASATRRLGELGPRDRAEAAALRRWATETSR